MTTGEWCWKEKEPGATHTGTEVGGARDASQVEHTPCTQWESAVSERERERERESD